MRACSRAHTDSPEPPTSVPRRASHRRSLAHTVLRCPLAVAQGPRFATATLQVRPSSVDPVVRARGHTPAAPLWGRPPDRLQATPPRRALRRACQPAAAPVSGRRAPVLRRVDCSRPGRRAVFEGVRACAAQECGRLVWCGDPATRLQHLRSLPASCRFRISSVHDTQVCIATMNPGRALRSTSAPRPGIVTPGHSDGETRP